MRNRDLGVRFCSFFLVAVRPRCAILLLPGFILGCAATQAPRGWLASPTAMQTESYGGWVKLQYSTAAKKKVSLAGELIAIDADSVFLAGDTFHAIALSDLKSARLETYQSNSAGMGGLVGLGTVSTISNGLLLIFTAPIWIIGGSVTTGVRSREPMIDYPRREWSRLAAFARFPQGLPGGIDRRQIKIKAP